MRGKNIFTETMVKICESEFQSQNLAFNHDLVRHKTRDQAAVAMRRKTAKILRMHGFTFAEIASFINRDHCTVMHLFKSSSDVVELSKESGHLAALYKQEKRLLEQLKTIRDLIARYPGMKEPQTPSPSSAQP